MNNIFFTPLDQFEIRDFLTIDAPILGDIHISLTNMSFYIIISSIIIITLTGLINKFPKFIIIN
jgi:F-type H+-transporting ATPase subunit a